MLINLPENVIDEFKKNDFFSLLKSNSNMKTIFLFFHWFRLLLLLLFGILSCWRKLYVGDINFYDDNQIRL